MNLGKVQKKIIAHLEYLGGQGYISPVAKIDNLAPYDWSDIGPALERLLKRGIVRKIRPLGIYEIVYRGRCRKSRAEA